MKAIIVGAGPGGLTAALFLHRLGWTTEIYESTARIEPLGVGINLLPHGVRELMVLGLGEELAATGIPTRALEYRTRYGHLIYSDPRGRYAGFDFPSYSIHRGHPPSLIQRDDSCCDVLQQRLDVATSLLQPGVRSLQFEIRTFDLPAAVLQLPGHSIERLDQIGRAHV